MGEEQQTPQIVHMNTNLCLPPELHLNTRNVSENFKTWKRQVEIAYVQAAVLHNSIMKRKLQQSLIAVVNSY